MRIANIFLLLCLLVCSSSYSAVTHVANGTGVGAAGTSGTIDPVWPTHTTGDIGVATLIFWDHSVPPASFSGWTLLGQNQKGAANAYLQVWCRPAASASEATPQFPFSGGVWAGSQVAGHITVYRGASCTTSGTAVPDDGAVNGTTVPYGAFTPAHAGALVIVAGVFGDNDVSSFSVPSGLVDGGHSISGTGDDVSEFNRFVIQTTAVEVAADAVTATGAAIDAWFSLVLALQAAGLPPAIAAVLLEDY